jgi:UDP-N-acetylglucosamine 2-epimerase (non-hydrolysing)
MKIHLIAAARPNFMKIAPLYHELKKYSQFEVEIIHTGQHYDKNMFADIFADLSLPSPDVSLNVGSGSHSFQVANVMLKYEEYCELNRPDLLIVVGDVNATMACSIVAKKLHIKVAHLEAGLRSFDKTMPEEINRMVTDSIVDLFWTPSIDANENLLKAGINKEDISLVGNIMIDSLEMMRDKINQETIVEDLKISQDYGVITFHRPSNVDNKEDLIKLVNQLVKVSKLILLVFPVHPRTKKQLEKFGLYDKLLKQNIIMTAPLNYKKFMKLVFGAKIVITDSGGIQEETTYLNIACLTVRENTERPITITDGTNELVSIEDIFNKTQLKLNQKNIEHTPPQFWDGDTAKRVVELLK